MVTDDQLSELVALVARWALGAKHRIVTAESCTGGWIAKAFTDAAGSSRWFECGYVTYSNAAKVRDLGVSERTLAEHGAVSEPTVREMAAGALRVTGADVSIAVSGIAGPDGGSPEKPVGTVWFCVGRRVGDAVGAHGAGASGAGVGSGVAARGAGTGAQGGGEDGGPNAAGGPGFELIAEGEVFAGDRETVRRASVKRSLELVLQFSRRG
jgi:nicotinamide-nucleotide amidase